MTTPPAPTITPAELQLVSQAIEQVSLESYAAAQAAFLKSQGRHLEAMIAAAFVPAAEPLRVIASS
jgi:hypothetical protein